MQSIKAVIFDWGNTVMREFPQYSGPMAQWPRVKCVSNIPGALRRLQGKFICCLTTDNEENDAQLMELALKRIGIQDYFNHLYTSAELGVRKPDPRFFERIVEKLEITPQECIMVGTDYERDIVPAKKVGMRTIFFTENTNTADHYPQADYIITTMIHLVSSIMGN